MIKELAEAIKTFTPSQWGVIATIIGGTIGAWAWIDNRFADKNTSEMILNHLITIDSKITAVITSQYKPEQIKEINDNAAKLEEQMRKYLEIKNKK